MAWYIRKSFRINKLLRLNLSKSGLGFSVGVKGARVGINSRGKPYTHVGRYGLYHRKVYGRTTPAAAPLQIGLYKIAILFLPFVLIAALFKSVVLGNWPVFFFCLFFLPLSVAFALLILWPDVLIRKRRLPVHRAEEKKEQWQKEPITQLQEAHICYLFNERELPSTANYTDATTALVAFKNAYGRQVTQEEAAGLISFLEGLPIKEIKEIKETHTKIVAIIVAALMFAAALLVAFWAPQPVPAVSTQTDKAAEYDPYKLATEKRLIEIARKNITDGYASEVRDIGSIPKQSPNYAEAQAVLASRTPQMIARSLRHIAQQDVEHERYVQERQKSKVRLWEQYEWCMGMSRTPWLEHKERAHAYLEFLMKNAYLETHSNLKGWTSKWRP